MAQASLAKEEAEDDCVHCSICSEVLYRITSAPSVYPDKSSFLLVDVAGKFESVQEEGTGLS